MIVITNVIIHGKGATKWFKRMADYFNQRQPSINARVMKPMSGNMAELMLERTFESYDVYRKFTQEHVKDPNWKEFGKEAEENGYSTQHEQYIYEVVE